MRIQEEIINLNGHTLLIRNPEKSDARMMLDYLKETSEETRFLVREPEEITITMEEEYRFIDNQNESEDSLMLLGFLDGEYAGNCALMRNSRSRFRHRANVCIALYQKYTGKGIGTAMLGKMIQIATDIGLEQLELEVVADNQRALSLYQKMGFEIFGTFPHNMKYKDGTYADMHWMMKRIEG